MRTMIRTALVCVMALAVAGVSAQPPRGEGERPRQTREERARQRTERLKKELGLSDAQEKQVYELQLKSAMVTRSTDGGAPDREKMRAEVEKRMKEMSAGMKEILTAEQFAKWEKQQAERRQNMGRGRGGERPPVQP